MLNDESVSTSTIALPGDDVPSTIAFRGDEVAPMRSSGQIRDAYRDFLRQYHASLMREVTYVEAELDAASLVGHASPARECLERPERPPSAGPCIGCRSRAELLRDAAILSVFVVALNLDQPVRSWASGDETAADTQKARDQLNAAIGILQTI